MTANRTTTATVRAVRMHGARRARFAIAGLAVLVAVLFLVSLSVGTPIYSPGDVWKVLTGQFVPGASFIVGELRLPRATLAAVAGACFGLAGVTFQTMLRNPLASPDIIGITNGANAAALFAIVVLGLSGLAVSLGAVAAGVATAAVIYALASSGAAVGTRLILVGIGIAAMLNSVTAYLLVYANEWDLSRAMRWLNGSLNLADWDGVALVALPFVVLTPVLLLLGRRLMLLRLGEDLAAGLGVPVETTRRLLVLVAVALAAFATAATGPILFVAFMAGPIATRLVGHRGSLMVPSALVGAALVLAADLIGQYAFDARYPVGVITGALGAPFLIYLLIRTQRTGGSL
ncbi:iron chelate uptake ABC transporter family permease subunit [Aeromicrobium sp. 636]|uniref:Iron ABC transporter permease n=1 Tax=Aeromicrobium senzhongii TaxID=2663859 RepID=A0A8I0EUU7_9ACTN|nr:MULTISPECIES: iron ABC transporter permease [Aeromicrobium]MBC9226038.1 iron ABC transporter permease [Aeromicrobium senzhongii]MCQ3998145.1 iron chelate uptake ABC transporter family permease subunit [Aeromicrobium sp. 636]